MGVIMESVDGRLRGVADPPKAPGEEARREDTELPKYPGAPLMLPLPGLRGVIGVTEPGVADTGEGASISSCSLTSLSYESEIPLSLVRNDLPDRLRHSADGI